MRDLSGSDRLSKLAGKGCSEADSIIVLAREAFYLSAKNRVMVIKGTVCIIGMTLSSRLAVLIRVEPSQTN